MGKVIVLDEDTANRIAAGEVVERPSSVVKELVENSLDACATKISVEIKKGGIASIMVSDDGEGFYSDDVLMAFERYATSKLRSAEDLENVATLGFRGEALPSIASVSKVRLVTRRRGSEYGKLVEIHAGRLVRDESVGCPNGTTITVSELFYNMPARYKFLKKDSSEAAQISELMGKLAIGRPDVSFTLTTQSAQLMHTQGGGEPGDAVFAVFGKDMHAGLIPFHRMSEGHAHYSVSGYIGRPEMARANRNYQLFYINNRLVKNRVIGAAVEAAYKSHIPNRRFPVAIVYISMDAALVDVNAHPAKTEVRFQNESDLYRAVFHAVESGLKKTTIQESLDASSDYTSGHHTDSDYTSSHHTDSDYTNSHHTDSDYTNSHNPNCGYTNGYHNDFNTAGTPTLSDAVNSVPPPYNPIVSGGMMNGANTNDGPVTGALTGADPHLGSINKYEVSVNKGLLRADAPSLLRVDAPDLPSSGAPAREQLVISMRDAAPEGERLFITEREAETVNTALFGSARYLGQLFGTYIALEWNGALTLVDQHAAHERMLYEEIKAKYEKNAISRQILLESVTVNLLPDEMLFVSEAAPFFEKAGFLLEEFGREAIIIREVPLYMERTDIKEFFLDTLEIVRRNIDLGKAPGDSGISYDNVLYSIACKAAVKGNKQLSPNEAIELLRALDDLPKPLTCPHGRPLVVSVPKRDFDRKFLRV